MTRIPSTGKLLVCGLAFILLDTSFCLVSAQSNIIKIGYDHASTEKTSCTILAQLGVSGTSSDNPMCSGRVGKGRMEPESPELAEKAEQEAIDDRILFNLDQESPELAEKADQRVIDDRILFNLDYDSPEIAKKADREIIDDRILFNLDYDSPEIAKLEKKNVITQVVGEGGDDWGSGEDRHAEIGSKETERIKVNTQKEVVTILHEQKQNA